MNTAIKPGASLISKRDVVTETEQVDPKLLLGFEHRGIRVE